MDTIKAYQEGCLSYDEFQDFMWGSGQRLIEEIGEDQFVFYLLAEEGNYYEKR